MLVEQRYQKILDLMQDDGSVRVSKLKREMDVSAETIRRDLEHMEAAGLIRRTRGGAFLNKKQRHSEEGSSYTPFGIRSNENIENKQKIAEYAATFIKEGQSIALDSGTTAFALAKVIKKRFHALTIITNSWAILNELADAEGLTLIATGGVYKPDEKAYVSDMAGMIFSKLSINTFFLTTCGISADKGVTYQRMDEIIVQEKMMEASERTIVIADSSKLGVNSLVKMCDIDKIDTIITDSEISDAQIEKFAKASVQIQRA